MKSWRTRSRSWVSHALALNLLTGYLTEWHDGRIAGLADLPPGVGPRGEGRHARRVIAAWEARLGDGPEIEVLRTLGLFDAPAERAALEAVWGGDEIQGLNEWLREGDAEAAIERLREWKLTGGAEGRPPPGRSAWTAIRCYGSISETRLASKLPEAWTEGSSRLFEYYQSVPEKHQPDTLEELGKPLQGRGAWVRGGALPGCPDDAVYWDADHSVSSEFYQTKKLGAFGSDLAGWRACSKSPGGGRRRGCRRPSNRSCSTPRGSVCGRWAGCARRRSRWRLPSTRQPSARTGRTPPSAPGT